MILDPPRMALAATRQPFLFLSRGAAFVAYVSSPELPSSHSGVSPDVTHRGSPSSLAGFLASFGHGFQSDRLSVL